MNPGGPESTAAGRAPYRSPLRDTQAAQTRERVLEAAAELFVRRGYLRSTMRDIAAAAGVSVETVYAQGSKQALLLAAVDRALAGPEAGVALIETAPVAQALEADSVADVIGGFAHALADIAARAAGLIVAFEDAAAADAATLAVWTESEERRRQDYRRWVDTIAARGALRDGLDVARAADGLWCTLSPRLAHRLLSTGWSPDQVADWAAAVVASTLLPPAPARPPATTS